MKSLKFLALPLAAFAAASASASVAFDTFGSDEGGFGYNSGSGFAITGIDSGVSNFGQGFEFTATTSGELSSLVLAFAYNSGTGPANIEIFADNGSNTITGSAIYTWTNVNTDATFGTYGTPTTLTATGGPTITAGDSYWVAGVALGSTNSVYDVMNGTDNSTYASVTRAYSTNAGSTWNYVTGSNDAAFEVNVQATPEPASVCLLGLGVLAFIRRRR